MMPPKLGASGKTGRSLTDTPVDASPDLAVEAVGCLHPNSRPVPRLNPRVRLHPLEAAGQLGSYAVAPLNGPGCMETTGEHRKAVQKIYIDLRPVLAAVNEPEDSSGRCPFEQEASLVQCGVSTPEQKDILSPEPPFQCRMHPPSPWSKSEATWLVKTVLPPIAKSSERNSPSPEHMKIPGASHPSVALVSLSEDSSLMGSNRCMASQNSHLFHKMIFQQSSPETSSPVSTEMRPSLEPQEVGVPIQLLLKKMRERETEGYRKGGTCPDHLLFARVLRSLREEQLHLDSPGPLESGKCTASKPSRGHRRDTTRTCSDPSASLSSHRRRKALVTLSLCKRSLPALRHKGPCSSGNSTSQTHLP
nr:PREDICTED: uncharacterized protein LOC107079686 [Lepisosteus oculatus]